MFNLPIGAHVGINIKGSDRRRLQYKTKIYMDCLGRSQRTGPLASIQAMPGSVPTTGQELAWYGEPRQRTHWFVDCNLTQQTQMRYSPYRRNHSSRPPRTRDNPSTYAIRMGDTNSTLFHYPSRIDHFINLLHWQEARWHLLRHQRICTTRQR